MSADNKLKSNQKNQGDRVRITYKPLHGDKAGEEVELPFRTLVIGNFMGYRNQAPLEERESYDVNADNFHHFMAESNIQLKLPEKYTSLLSIRSLSDFHPDQLVQNIPELQYKYQARQLLARIKQKGVSDSVRQRMIKSLQPLLMALFIEHIRETGFLEWNRQQM